MRFHLEANSQRFPDTGDQAMGFEHDLALAFAEYLGVSLKIKIADKWEGMIPALIDGSGAFIATSLTITPKRKKQVAFSDGYLAIRQHIIVNRKNAGVKKPSVKKYSNEDLSPNSPSGAILPRIPSVPCSFSGTIIWILSCYRFFIKTGSSCISRRIRD